MAFTRATGTHRAPGRLTRATARFAGAAALTATGVVGSMASPALAAEPATPSPGTTGLIGAVVLGDSIADRIADQAEAQHRGAEVRARAEAKARAEAAVRVREAREAKARAARAAERKRLNSFHLPIAGSYISTGYKSSGSLWSSGSHSGVDFHAATGTPVLAVGAGTVVEAGWGGAYGNNIVLRMADGTYTQYGHLSSIGVQVGQSVSSGERIGLSGATGNATGPHLHFEARTGPDYGSDMDPVAYLRAHGLTV
ncbi:M23 family metallopeptidase [Streptomyces sp. NBC_00102]|uniref:M23 family metallopeptidase n=1 Tax=Streptomyces sp. NBC_00102 TaxID=2975652 RepID=UPI00225211FB|nr:M23 family metallopeptidase [Streptomyces sp. NBC_00102]MCX5400238.1 M23 family metallopeptidase [Streptomyces sp. NBC_00102]